MKLAFIAICFLLAVHVNASLRAPVTKAKAKANFDFYVFASEWTGSVCSTNKCDKVDDEGVATNFWNIHGLWPSDGKMDVNYCSDEKFDPSQLNSLKSELAAYWSGLYSSADSFHSHEWEKHGTCAGMSQPDYFSTVLNLAKKIDVYGALQRNQIIPRTQTYTCDQVAAAIQKEYGVTSFTLQATSGYLTALQLCVNKSLQVINCPNTQKICKGNVKYPLVNL